MLGRFGDDLRISIVVFLLLIDALGARAGTELALELLEAQLGAHSLPLYLFSNLKSGNNGIK